MYVGLLSDVKEQSTGPKGLVYQVAAWHIMLKMLRLLENNFAAALEKQADAHSNILDQLICLGIGVRTTAATEKVNFSKKDHGTTIEELNATIDWLRDKRAMWYGDATQKRKAYVLKSLFGDVAA